MEFFSFTFTFIENLEFFSFTILLLLTIWNFFFDYRYFTLIENLEFFLLPYYFYWQFGIFFLDHLLFLTISLLAPFVYIYFPLGCQHSCDGPVHGEAAGSDGRAGECGRLWRPRGDCGGPLSRGRTGGRGAGVPGHLPECCRSQAGRQRGPQVR